MPIGCVSLVPALVADIHTEFCMKQCLSKIFFIDLGLGFGMYGAVIRQWFDYGVKPYRHYIAGVEGFNYRSPLWDLYDYIHQMTIEQYILLRSPDKYNVIFLLDVIEHFERPTAVAVVEELKNMLKPKGRLYVGTPGIWCEQGAVYGNELERHRTLWTATQFASMGLSVFRNFDGNTIDPYGNQMLVGMYEHP